MLHPTCIVNIWNTLPVDTDVSSFSRFTRQINDIMTFLKFRSSFTRSWDNSDWSFGRGVANPQSYGEEEAAGVGVGTVRKSVGEFL